MNIDSNRLLSMLVEDIHLYFWYKERRHVYSKEVIDSFLHNLEEAIEEYVNSLENIDESEESKR